MKIGSPYKRLRNHSILCTTAHDNRTMMQMAVKAAFFHKELGMRAGLPNDFCRCIQKTKAGISSTAIQSRVIFCGCRMLDVLPVIILRKSIQISHYGRVLVARQLTRRHMIRYPKMSSPKLLPPSQSRSQILSNKMAILVGLTASTSS